MNVIHIPISLMIGPLLPRNYLFVFDLLSLISSYFFPVFCFTVTGPSSVFPCWGGDPQSTGCTVNSHHITNDVDPRGFVKTLKSSGDKSKQKVYALGTIYYISKKTGWVQEILIFPQVQLYYIYRKEHLRKFTVLSTFVFDIELHIC